MNTVSHQLRIELSTAEGAMLRALGLMERRGYLLQTCRLYAEMEGRKVLDIQVESDRPASLLKRQLERLHDVLTVKVKSEAGSAVGKFNARTSK